MTSLQEPLRRYLLRYPRVCDAAFLGYLGYRRFGRYAGRIPAEERVAAHAAAIFGRSQPLLEQIPVKGKPVLFFTVRGWSTHVLWESVMAMGVRLRGADPRFFLCGGGLSQCDSKHPDLPRVNYSQCYRCMRWGYRILDAFGFRYHLLKEVLASAEAQLAEAMASSIKGDLSTFTLAGIPLGEYILPSLTRALGRGHGWSSQTTKDIQRGFLVGGTKMLFAVRRLLEDIQPQVVVLTNGLFFAERLMFEEALSRGIPVITYEKGKHLNHVVMARNRPVVRYELDEDWAIWRNRPLTSEEEQGLDESMGQRQKGHVGNEPLWNNITRDRDAVATHLALDPALPVVSLFTNVDWDTSVYGSKEAFPDMPAWVVETIRYFAENPKAQLVVRVHPAEVRLAHQVSRIQVAREVQRIFPVLPPNVRVVPPEDDISSYTLLDLSRAVVVNTSTIGLEAAVAGKPVLTAGRVHYAGRGFTFDANSLDHYRELLAALIHGQGLDLRSQDLARRYAYLFFHRFMHPLEAVHEEVGNEPRLNFEHLEALMPGQDVSLDRICDFILESKDTIPKNLVI